MAQRPGANAGGGACFSRQQPGGGLQETCQSWEPPRWRSALGRHGAPALLDYVSLPGRRAPLDMRIEKLAAQDELLVRSRSGLVLPGWRLRRRHDEVLVVNLALGQEAPGVRGSWGWHPLKPRPGLAITVTRLRRAR